MKKILYTIGLSATMLFTACEADYLDLDPQDTITEAAYFTEPSHFEAAANDFYNKMVSWREIDGSSPYDFMDLGTDLTAYTQSYGRGILTTSNGDKYWRNSYKYIRANNILLQKASEYKGDKTDIAQYVAEAKFFRAWHHFLLLQRFGGVPIVTTVLDLESPELQGKRMSRYQVMAQIIADLNDAIEALPLEQNIPSNKKGHISKWAAMSFKARVLLFEATWEKYVGTSTDGDGTSTGAGSEAHNPANVNTYLTEAVKLTKEVMDNGGYEIWNHNDKLNNGSSYFLFCLEDADSNPAGLDKSSNKEFILYNKYDYDIYQGGQQISHTVQSRMAASRKFMDMFLCTDGLPISKSPLFKGYAKVSHEYQNRDYRQAAYFGKINNGEIPSDGSVQLKGSRAYDGRKFRAYNYGTYRAARTESADYAQIRLAEVYLIYAEALIELNNAITDEQLNASVNKIRNRAGIASLTNALVNDNGLDMLQEIRRERTIELYGENSRYNDLKRWGIAESELNQDICSSVIEGSEFENNPDLYTPNVYPYGELSVETGKGTLRALLIDPAANRDFKRMHYLYPIPLEEIQLNNSLVQNPNY
ncbi:RagB/SusD family nutrient uptake outer membrane protein [Prolixibacteraceae bacterium JC049]|nr:RagB/SusD family nutrient uptake outer membrane protein [Prolixibacteraceae bacterium JC049]